ncbi:MAG: hypothetical protein ABI579_04340, partial [Candidatus Sumerlaeota bacterium]
TGDPARPGAFFTTEWGPSRLFDIRAISHRELRAVIEFCSIAIVLEADRMSWTLNNRRATPLGFQLALAANTAEGMLLARGEETIFLQGAGLVGMGPDLVLQLGPREAKIITVRFIPAFRVDGSNNPLPSTPKPF